MGSSGPTGKKGVAGALEILTKAESADCLLLACQLARSGDRSSIAIALLSMHDWMFSVQVAVDGSPPKRPAVWALKGS